jgi:hypothetical protein
MSGVLERILQQVARALLRSHLLSAGPPRSAAAMGAGSSAARPSDFEIVLRAAKELEFLLSTQFGAQGSSVHEMTSSIIELLPPDTVRRLRFLATLRNKIVHVRGFDALTDADRTRFLSDYDAALRELAELRQIMRSRPRHLVQQELAAAKQRGAGARGGGAAAAARQQDEPGHCVIA